MISAFLDLLATFYQAGNLGQMEAVARSMLHTIPNDVVALQFLGLALYRMGRIGDACAVFRKAAARDRAIEPGAGAAALVEPAMIACYREATRPGSRLAEGWHQLAQVLGQYGFRELAARAMRAAQRTRAH